MSFSSPRGLVRRLSNPTFAELLAENESIMRAMDVQHERVDTQMSRYQSENPKMSTRSTRSNPKGLVEGTPPTISPFKAARETQRAAQKARQSYSNPAAVVAEVRRKAAANRPPRKPRQSEAEPAAELAAAETPQKPDMAQRVALRLEETRRQRRRELKAELDDDVARGKITPEYRDKQLAHEDSLWQPAAGSQFGVDRTSVEQDAREQARQVVQSAIQNATHNVEIADLMDQMLTQVEQEADLRQENQQQINGTSQIDANEAARMANPPGVTPAVLTAGDNNAITDQRSQVPVIDHRSVTANPYAYAFQDVGTVNGTNMANSTVESRVNARMKALPTDSLWWLKDPLKMKEDSVDAQLARAAVAYQAKNPQFEKKNEQEVERLLSRTPVYRVYASDCAQSVSSVPSMVKLF